MKKWISQALAWLLLLALLTGCTIVKNPSKTATAMPVDGELKVHFIDVGQADAALVQCDGMNMLIDGGNVEDSNLLYTYLKKNGVTHLDYVIGTHAHEDHIGGLSGALRYASVDTAYCPVTSFDSKAFENFKKAVSSHGATLEIPAVGTSFGLGDANVQILAVNTTEDTNNSSIVLQITYGETSFLFTGDAETEVERALIDSGVNLQTTVLKVGHHGSDTSSSYAFLRSVMPQYSVISVGKDNTYGHPAEEILSRLRDCGTKLYRTDMQGDIICVSDGKTVRFSVSRNANADTFDGIGDNSTGKPVVIIDVVLNTNSKVFHAHDCASVGKMNPENRKAYSGTREELIEQGYTACKSCEP